jgi:hypothetical protein
VAERRADTRGHRQHRGDAGHDLQVEATPGGRTRLDLLANGGRHREHAGVAAGHQCHVGTGGRGFERGAGAQRFFAIVGWVTGLPITNRSSLEIRSVTEQRIGRGQGGIGFQREPADVSWTEPDHGKPAAHGRPSQPGTSTMAK